jgi:hypothetical protein
VFVQLFVQMLGYLSLYGRGSSAEFIKAYVEPLVNIRMNFMVVITEFPRRYPLLCGFGFRGGTVFVCAADIKGFVTPQPAKPGKDIGGQYLNQVPQVRHIVYIG